MIGWVDTSSSRMVRNISGDALTIENSPAVEIGGKGAGIELVLPAEQIDRIGGIRARELPGKIDLIAFAVEDVAVDFPDRLIVIRSRHSALDERRIRSGCIEFRRRGSREIGGAFKDVFEAVELVVGGNGIAGKGDGDQPYGVVGVIDHDGTVIQAQSDQGRTKFIADGGIDANPFDVPTEVVTEKADPAAAEDAFG